MPDLRALTPAEEARLLTQDAVEALPVGTTLWIKWRGGNGPYRYKLGRSPYDEVTLVPLDDGQYLTGYLETRFVGTQPWNHRCFLPEGSPAMRYCYYLHLRGVMPWVTQEVPCWDFRQFLEALAGERSVHLDGYHVERWVCDGDHWTPAPYPDLPAWSPPC